VIHLGLFSCTSVEGPGSDEGSVVSSGTTSCLLLRSGRRELTLLCSKNPLLFLKVDGMNPPGAHTCDNDDI
jgi:hypothetical protein